MNSHEAARINVYRARAILEEARRHQAQGVWNLTVRRAQEVVEIALKGVLLWAGVEVPRIHDVGPVLRANASRFPTEFSQHISRLVSISRALAVERERSFYGDELSGLPPEELYDRQDAQEALDRAGFVLDTCQRLV